MSKTKAWIQALRLRTLPLSSAGVVLAAGLAAQKGYFDWKIFAMTLLTANLLQILSNLANDYGDYTKGTDNNHRIGPPRALQSGAITRPQIIRGMIIETLLTIISGLLLLWLAFGVENTLWIAAFAILGALSIWAAVQYTVGKRAYGYYALGDAFVFVFFGLVAVQGGFFLYTHTWEWLSLLPAVGVGLMSVAVLNLNNMRDVENDKACGKRTLATRMSFVGGKIYHTALIVGSAAVFSLYLHLIDVGIAQVMAPVLLLLPSLGSLWVVKQRKEFDKMLKIQAITTLILAILFVFLVN